MHPIKKRFKLAVLAFVFLALSSTDRRVCADTESPCVVLTPAARGLVVGPGMNAAGRDLRGCEFVGQDLTGAVFDGCNLHNVRIYQCALREASFRAVVFAGAEVTDLWAFGGAFSALEGADFADATMNAAQRFPGPLSDLKLSPQQLMSTWSYKKKDLRRCVICGSDHSGRPATLDFSGADLREARLTGDLTDCDFANARVYGADFQHARLTFQQLASTLDFKQRSLCVQFQGGGSASGLLGKWDFSRVNLEGSHLGAAPPDADFTDARITRCTLLLSKGQLYSTKSYQDGNLTGWRVLWGDLSGFNLSGMNLTDCHFSHCKFAATSFVDAVITGAWFVTDKTVAESDRLTVEQIKSTWNYRHGHMKGIRLPEEVAKALGQEQHEK